MDLGLKGKYIAIIGASRGIGAASARAIAAEGAIPILMARPSAALNDLALELKAPKIAIDASDSTKVAEAFTQVSQAYQTLDGCIISVGAAQGGLMWALDDRVWQDAMDLKFMGTLRVLRAIAPMMQAQGHGKIVVVVGNNGRQPHPRMLPGSAANAACLALVRGLAEELAADGVSINALNPGPTRTDRWDRLIANMATAEGRPASEIEARQLATMPRGRIAEPEEMGRLAAILCSDLADMVTGSALTADGGATKGLP